MKTSSFMEMPISGGHLWKKKGGVVIFLEELELYKPPARQLLPPALPKFPPWVPTSVPPSPTHRRVPSTRFWGVKAVTRFNHWKPQQINQGSSKESFGRINRDAQGSAPWDRESSAAAAPLGEVHKASPRLAPVSQDTARQAPGENPRLPEAHFRPGKCSQFWLYTHQTSTVGPGQACAR